MKLPGPAQDKPIVFEFSTPYQQMYDVLKQQDEELYTSKGILNMLQRNSKIKERPQRFQDEKMPFDIIITFEERVFDIVIEDLNNRESITGEMVHVINLNVKDNHEEATLGAIEVLNLLTLVGDELSTNQTKHNTTNRMISTAGENEFVFGVQIENAGPDWSDRIDEILEDLHVKQGKPFMLHSVHFY